MARILTAGAEHGDITADGFVTYEGPILNRVSGNTPISPDGNTTHFSFYTTQNTGMEYDFEPAIPAGLNEFYMRMHFEPSLSNGIWEILRFSTPGGDPILRWAIIDFNSGGTNGGRYYHAFYNNAISQIVNASGFGYRNNEWNLFELHVKFGGSGARIRLKANGFLIIDWTGSLVGPAAESVFHKFQINNALLSGGNARTNYYDNIAINDTTGTINNSWIGDGYILPFYPSGNGTTTQLTNSARTSVDNFNFINKRRVLNPLGFVAPTAPNDKDTYALPAPPQEFQGVNAIAMTASAVRHGTSITQARMLIQPPSPQAEIQGASLALPQGSDDFIRDEFNNNTNTGGPFTIAELEDMEAGIQFLA